MDRGSKKRSKEKQRLWNITQNISNIDEIMNKITNITFT